VNNKTLWGGAITVMIALFLGATGWLFNAVADLPEEYVKKEDHKFYIEQNREDHKRIEQKIDLVLKHLLRDKDDEED
jgi:hypothetical protein